VKTFLFESKSDPKKVYHTVAHDNGAVTCNCPAWKECWHVKQVKERKPVGRTEITEIPVSDRLAIQKLVHEGNDDGAIAYLWGLFPSMSLEEMTALSWEIALLEDVYDGPEES